MVALFFEISWAALKRGAHLSSRVKYDLPVVFDVLSIALADTTPKTSRLRLS